MKRGRPTYSEIRQNLVEILSFKKKAYGYELYKLYTAIYGKVSLRLIYYHLKKGLALGEFAQAGIQKEEGDFSWGSTVEKVMYGLGKEAKPQSDAKAKDYFSKKR
ncbi:hypothetical protein CMO92_00190 [Candidatus Woesearchaeota archaeon]|nr:hypothetical protein [Candidatus Woesearchaeota archaeon]